MIEVFCDMAGVLLAELLGSIYDFFTTRGRKKK